MAYLAFVETVGGPLVEGAPLLTPAPKHDPAGPVREASFSALEWSVVALARRDTLSSLRAPGRLSIALGTLFGDRGDPRLADERLEALRRMAVLSWHHSYAVPPAEIRAFVAAGYSADQYETLLRSISAARTTREQRSYR